MKHLSQIIRKTFTLTTLVFLLVSTSWTASTQEEFGGLGITIRTVPEGINVVSVLKNTPAWEAGLQINDVILSADGQSLENKNIEQAKNMLRGPVGSVAALKISRDGIQMDANVVRTSLLIRTYTTGDIRDYYQSAGEESLTLSTGELQQMADFQNNGGLQQADLMVNGRSVQDGAELNITSNSNQHFSAVYIPGLEDASNSFQNLASPFELQIGPAEINYSVPAEGNVEISILNANGQVLKHMPLGAKSPGSYTTNWDSSNLQKGKLVFRIRQGSSVLSHSMIWK